jgi:hypothetical protein
MGKHTGTKWFTGFPFYRNLVLCSNFFRTCHKLVQNLKKTNYFRTSHEHPMTHVYKCIVLKGLEP